MNDTDTQAILGASGPGELVEALGQVWHVSPATLHVQAGYAAWLKLQARKELIDTREDLGEQVYREEMTALKARIDAGEYNWGGPVWRTSIGREAGFCYLFWLMLQKKHPTTMGDNGKPRPFTPEDASAIYWSNRELCQAAVEAMLEVGDPKRFVRPAKKTAETDEVESKKTEATEGAAV